MAEHLPPLSALRAFEATIRNGSLTGASAELNVTPAAVSQQLRILEGHFGISLLDRSRGKLNPTAEGAELGAALTLGFQQIRDAVALVGVQADELPLRISTTQSFAANWLMPKMQSFRRNYPNIEVIVVAHSVPLDLETGKIDAVIRYCATPPDNVESLPLLMSGLSVIGARSLVGNAPPSTPFELFRFPWLLEPEKSIFADWLRAQGLRPEDHRNSLTIEGGMHYAALMAGQGIALMGRELARIDIDSGRLMVLFDNIDARENTGYRLLWLSRYERPALRHFVRWLSGHRETMVAR